ncbi:MAG: DNA polymerase III subunit delta [Bacteroidales bacterium]|nr:DNA polymerase III subunit delta [Bacteroidales bacterium]
MEFQQIISRIKQKKYAPIYFLTGEEPYFIDKISNYITANVLTENEKAFNQVIVYGKDADAATIINNAKQFPMMSQFRVVVVREAQYVNDIDKLVYYVSNPLKSTILVLNYKYKKLDKRTKLYKEFGKECIFFESKKLYENQISEWIGNYLKEKGYDIQPPASMLLTEFLGNDLSKIEKEIEKLLVCLGDGEKTINTQHIEENIGISKEYNTIELQKALIKKDALKAFRIVDYFGSNPRNNPIILTITSLYFFFNKVFLFSLLKDKTKQNITDILKISTYFLPEYKQAAAVYPPAKVVQIIGYLREYDLKSKGVGSEYATEHDLLRELVYKILS